MQLAAPIFRRACPVPLNEFINLPTLFATTIPAVHYYVMMDAILGMLTVRPMFFRYTIRFTPEAPESLFSRAERRSLVCAFGISDQLIMTFAYMNGLLEDFGSCVPQYLTDELEQDIKRMKPIVGVSTEPFLMIGRMAVQQTWFQAALIYLYMGLCCCDSTDGRVVTVRSQFINLLASTKPQRNVDAFLVFPFVILGVATESQEERNMIRRRMLGVPECARPGRMGNDFVRILENIWSIHRPMVWSDLRQACWEAVAYRGDTCVLGRSGERWNEPRGSRVTSTVRDHLELATSCGASYEDLPCLVYVSFVPPTKSSDVRPTPIPIAGWMGSTAAHPSAGFPGPIQRRIHRTHIPLPATMREQRPSVWCKAI
ncbi:hypothetical protein RSOLAG22IIIB_12625 [Rhizoctonia solani]|uniref:Uncharacterized protein n=1 Tax=Rhizoctonia solani TaxID=456999 RepID=A0A0K6GFF5_9AGAM|nr:hypothetical protein RSOLAG22IIIB_12625 [Rhizoctonia solani]